jgi:hypothetical protein
MVIQGKITPENIGQLLNRYSTAELEEMVVKFPYFREAHILLAKKYQQENNPKFDQQLQVAALYTNDRELLYNLFNEKAVKQKPSFTFESISTDTEDKSEEMFSPVQEEAPTVIIDIRQDIEEQIIEEPVQSEVPVEEVITAPVEQEDIEVEIAVDEPIVIEEQTEEVPLTLHRHEAVITEPVEQETVVEEINTPEVVLTEELTEQVTDNEVVLEESAGFETEEPLPVNEPKVLELLTETEIEAAITPQDSFDDVQEDEEGVEVIKSEKEAEVQQVQMFNKYEPHTFDEWLKFFNKTGGKVTEQPKASEEEKAADEELNKLIVSSVPLDILHEAVEEETRYSKGVSKFIEEQISLKKTKPTVKKQAKTGPESDLDPSLVTETLAKLYVAQNKYSRAIRAYEILTLKFPEKSDFFAARINYLKSLLI